MGSRTVDRIVGITLGIALGVAIVVVFVFFGSEMTIDAPRLNHGQQQTQQTQSKLEGQPPARTER